MVHRLFLVLVVFLATVALPLHAKAVRKIRQDQVQNIRPFITKKPITPKYLSCSYTGDPHLLAFYQPYTQFWCQHHGWELLISNKYFTIYTFADSVQNYFISDYKLVFADSSCSMGGPANPLPCSTNSLITSAATPPSYQHFHQGGEFIIKIEHNGRYYNFYIWQSPKLVEESCGVCVKWDCPQEPRWMQANPVVPKICDVFANTASKHAIGAIDPRIVDVATTSCVNDLQTTFDVRAARTALTIVLQDGIKDLLGDERTAQSVLEKVEAVTREVRKEAEDQANEILKGSGPICNEEKKCLQPFGPEGEEVKQ